MEKYKYNEWGDRKNLEDGQEVRVVALIIRWVQHKEYGYRLEEGDCFGPNTFQLKEKNSLFTYCISPDIRALL